MTVTVTALSDTSVGVPDMVPVDVFNDSPACKVPVSEKVLVPVPPDDEIASE